MEWSNDLCLKLIDEYEKREELWNPNHPFHYRQSNKVAAWKSIGEAVGRTVYEVRRKMETLHAGFRRERSKLRRKRDQEIYYEPQWFAYRRMEFFANRRLSECKYVNEKRDDTEKPPEEILLLNTIKDCSSPTASETNPLEANSPKSTIDIFSDEITNDVLHENTEQDAPAIAIKRRKCDMNFSDTRLQLVDDVTKTECDAFTNFLSKKLQSYNNRLRSIVQYQIHGIIHEADMEQFDNDGPEIEKQD
ncbi:Myb/SANT-like transcription factor [Oryctes borbonicus]|uniref:Myb/SANT-like transcription factor n=1 Tax=Oryctes borbonicus TaxID=1629725 RepID=A0A0T6BG92_9SCAR|nr:Myb/SANT-like transcription factor [Oryctes borbonicus]